MPKVLSSLEGSSWEFTMVGFVVVYRHPSVIFDRRLGRLA